MSLRYALVGLLASEPMSGYDLTKRFAVSLANVWPAQHSQIYPELARLVADGLIEQTGSGPRGRKIYAATPAGVAALREWMRTTEPDYTVRCDALLRGFFLWTLSSSEAVTHLERDAEVYRYHLAELEELAGNVEWDRNGGTRSGRITIEMGVRYYRSLVEWTEWAAAQVAAGALEPGRPPSGDDNDSRRRER